MEGLIESRGGGLGGRLADVMGTAPVMGFGERSNVSMNTQCIITLSRRD